MSTTIAPGLSISHVFATPDVDPFDEVEWTRRDAIIKDEKGKVIFQQDDVEVPAEWSPLATNVVVSKYFHGDAMQGTIPEGGGRESSVRQLIHRVSRTIASWGRDDGYFATTEDANRFERELTWLCLHQYGSFNSPVWFNVGLYDVYGLHGSANNYCWDDIFDEVLPCKDAYEHPQISACFIQSVDDDMGSIMDLAKSEAMLFKYGSGTGSDLSTLRSTREKLAGGGKPSGPVSFMRVYDAVASVVKSGGVTRRAAKIQTLKVHHPDILEFIECKTREEKKARALIAAGYESNFNGEAYSSVCFQNSNLSVRVTDHFMECATRPPGGQATWFTSAVTTGGPIDSGLTASQILDKIAEGTWFCGDPGMQYHDIINRWHTCPNTASIESTNPCSEYVFINDSACNLASLNLMKFRRDDGTFDVERFRAAVRIFIIAQEILVDRGSYPTAEIAQNSHDYRPLGLGYANLGSLIMANGLPYDSDEGRNLAAAITAIMTGQAYLTSSELAQVKGPFEGFALNQEPMLDVMKMHYDEACGLKPVKGDSAISDIAWAIWHEAFTAGKEHGYRNAQVTVIAPTGTIGFKMDCATTGVEPDIALVKYKQLAGGGMLKITNQTVPIALRKLLYTEDAIAKILAYIEEHDTIEGALDDKDDLPVFDCAFPPAQGGRSIAWQGHVKMLAAVQPFLSGASSKTVNMPRDATVADIRDAYIMGWKLGVKCLAIYRDGSKESQPVSTGQTKPDVPVVLPTVDATPRRERLPATRQSVTHKMCLDGYEAYITVGKFPDGRPGELFVTMSKEGSTVGGLMDVIGTLTSLSLQYGVPLDVLVSKFSHVRFEPSGFTKNPDIPIAKSIMDYVVRWMGMEFLPGYREQNAPQRPADPTPAVSASPAPVVAPDPVSDLLEALVALRLNQVDVPLNPSLPPSDMIHALRGMRNDNVEVVPATMSAAPPPPGGPIDFARQLQSDAPACDTCGAITVRCGTCYRCFNCGNSMGCS